MSVSHPAGFSRILFKKDDEYTLVPYEGVIATLGEEIDMIPVKASDLRIEQGHANTHKFLKSFGNQWYQKNNFLFFQDIVTKDDSNGDNAVSPHGAIE